MTKFIRSAKRFGTKNAIETYFRPKNEKTIGVEHTQPLIVLQSDESDDEFGIEDSDEDDFFVPQGGNLDDPLGYFLINPDGLFRQFWNNMNLLMIFYVATVTPYKISYLGNLQYKVLDIIEYGVDVFFVADIIVTFFTPILIKFQLITNHFKIAYHYLKFWFWLDFFSVIPISSFLEGSDLFGIDFLTTLLKIPRIYKLIKISKLSRTMRFRKR